MIKRIVFSVILALLLASVPLFPAAAATTAGPEARNPSTARSERLAVRQELLDLRIRILDNRQQILSLVSQNEQLRLALKAKLKAAKGSLDPALVTRLKDAQVQLRDLMQDLRATWGENRELTLLARTLALKRDFAGLQDAYKAISKIQETRLETLQAINQLLEKMLSWF
jgi:hypothetical protein